MTPAEYKEGLLTIDREHENKRRALMVEYASGLRKFGKGDIIKQHNIILEITGFGTYTGISEYPDIVYKGNELTKALKVRAKDPANSIYGNENTELLKAASK